MYFSDHNKKITYSNHWDGLLEVCGSGPVVKEDTEVSPGRTKDLLNDGYDLSLTYGITSVGPGFIEQFRHLRSLILSYTVQDIAMTPELKDLLVRNNVVIRSWYASFGERFAKENNLKFLHADIFIGWHSAPEQHCSTKLTIRFRPDGTPYREYDDYCPGISAGNNGGGVWERDLPKDFYVGETLQSFAEFLPNYREPILKNKDLEYFLYTANRRRK